MHNEKKCILTFAVLLLLGIFLLYILYISPQIFLLIISKSGKNPPRPQITYGEFPFSIEYEVNGEIISVNDIVVCRFDGIGYGSNGKFLKWKKYIKSTGQEDLMLISEENIKVFCTIGEADYYMGESKDKAPPYPNLYIEEYKGSIAVSSANPSELEKYNIKVIGYEFSQPIENKFE